MRLSRYVKINLTSNFHQIPWEFNHRISDQLFGDLRPRLQHMHESRIFRSNGNRGIMIGSFVMKRNMVMLKNIYGIMSKIGNRRRGTHPATYLHQNYFFGTNQINEWN